MQGLLTLSRGIDWVSGKLAVIANWLVLLACLVSAGNAIMRYMNALNSNNSNAWLEVQWYMFAGMVMLGAPYVLKVNEHVRVDLVYGWVSEKTRHRINLFGALFFLMPMAVLMTYESWPSFWQSYVGNEQSANAGGLPRWPVKLLLPVGFGWLAVQGISEIIKTIATMRGVADAVAHYERPLQ